MSSGVHSFLTSRRMSALEANAAGAGSVEGAHQDEQRVAAIVRRLNKTSCELLQLGQWERARRTLGEAMSLLSDSSTPQTGLPLPPPQRDALQAITLNNQGIAELRQPGGSPRAALALFTQAMACEQQAVQVDPQAVPPPSAGQTLLNMCVAHVRLGQYASAHARALSALRTLSALPTPNWEATNRMLLAVALHNLGAAMEYTGQHEAAGRTYAAGAAVCRTCGAMGAGLAAALGTAAAELKGGGGRKGGSHAGSQGSSKASSMQASQEDVYAQRATAAWPTFPTDLHRIFSTFPDWEWEGQEQEKVVLEQQGESVVGDEQGMTANSAVQTHRNGPSARPVSRSGSCRPGTISTTPPAARTPSKGPKAGARVGSVRPVSRGRAGPRNVQAAPAAHPPSTTSAAAPEPSPHSHPHAHAHARAHAQAKKRHDPGTVYGIVVTLPNAPKDLLYSPLAKKVPRPGTAATGTPRSMHSTASGSPAGRTSQWSNSSPPQQGGQGGAIHGQAHGQGQAQGSPGSGGGSKTSPPRDGSPSRKAWDFSSPVHGISDRVQDAHLHLNFRPVLKPLEEKQKKKEQQEAMQESQVSKLEAQGPVVTASYTGLQLLPVSMQSPSRPQSAVGVAGDAGVIAVSRPSTPVHGATMVGGQVGQGISRSSSPFQLSYPPVFTVPYPTNQAHLPGAAVSVPAAGASSPHTAWVAAGVDTGSRIHSVAHSPVTMMSLSFARPDEAGALYGGRGASSSAGASPVPFSIRPTSAGSTLPPMSAVGGSAPPSPLQEISMRMQADLASRFDGLTLGALGTVLPASSQPAYLTQPAGTPGSGGGGGRISTPNRAGLPPVHGGGSRVATPQSPPLAMQALRPVSRPTTPQGLGLGLVPGDEAIE